MLEIHLRLMVLAAALVGMAAMSCTGESRSNEIGRNPSEQASSEKLSKVANDPIASMISQATDEEKPALADGKVTAAEYESAVLATAKCMTENGITFYESPHWDEATRSRLKFSYKGGSTREDALAADAIYDSCRTQHSAIVEQVWILQDLPSERTLQQARAEFEQCLRAAGVAVSEGATSGELANLSAQDAFWPCAKDVERKYQLPGFAG